jgi:hypothetical protein
VSVAEICALAVAGAALLTSLAQLFVAVNTHGVVATQVHQTNGLTQNIAGLNRTLGQQEGRAAASGLTSDPAATSAPPAMGPIGAAG